MLFIQGSPDVMSVDRLDSFELYALSNSVLCCWLDPSSSKGNIGILALL